MYNVECVIAAIMRLILVIEQKNRIKLNLVSGKKILDSLEWEENNNLSRLLLAKIGEILRRNKIRLDKISGYKIMSDVPQKWTTWRIAKITLETLKLAR
ncbi:MAG: hypothetical protein QMD77_03580 [Patescibacteria group bacterium]|nr:hypothetical protein [Patescibacteria group bacterium]